MRDRSRRRVPDVRREEPAEPAGEAGQAGEAQDTALAGEGCSDQAAAVAGAGRPRGGGRGPAADLVRPDPESVRPLSVRRHLRPGRAAGLVTTRADAAATAHAPWPPALSRERRGWVGCSIASTAGGARGMSYRVATVDELQDIA